MAGWFTAVPAILLLSATLYIRYSSFDIIRYEPLAMLEGNLSTGVPAVRDRAIAELQRRDRAGKLDEAALSPIVDQLLTWQKDRTHDWNRDWADWLKSIHDRALMPKSKWETFLSQSCQVNFRVSRKIHRGAKMMLWCSPYADRMATVSPMSFGMRLTGYVQSNTKSIPLNIGTFHGYGGGSAGIYLDFGDWSALDRNHPTLEIHYNLTMTDASGNRGLHTGTSTVNFEAVDPNVPLVRIVSDEETRSKLLKSIEFSGLSVPLGCIPLPKRTAAGDEDFSVRQEHPPIIGHFEVMLVQGQCHWKSRYELYTHPQNTGAVASTSLDRDKLPETMPHEGPAEIVLTPIVNKVDNSPELDTLYGGEPLHFPVQLVDADKAK